MAKKEEGRRKEVECVGLKDFAGALLDLLAGSNSTTTRRFAAVAIIRWLGGVAFFFNCDDGIDGLGEDLVHPTHLLTTALHVGGTHSLSHGTALFWCDGCQALCLEELNACSLVAEI